MYFLNLRSLSLVALAVLVAGSIGCTNNSESPDQIRQRTAAATETMKRDTKAVVEGVKEGLSTDKTVNINRASREDLVSLPGITNHDADHIIANRPFADAHDLVRRRVLSEAQYDKIRDRVVAGH